MKGAKGSGLEEVFQRYDTQGGKGDLNASEFATACEDIGFGELANDMFIEFDPDNSGTVNHGEILAQIHRNQVSRDAKRFITEIAFDADREETDLDTSDWKLNAENKEQLRSEIQYLLREHDPPGRVPDLFRKMCPNSDTMGREQFNKGMANIGFPDGNDWLLDAAFKQIDLNGDGEFNQKELRDWINGVEIRKALAKQMTLRSRPGAAKVNFIELDWNPALLREQLQLSLIHAGLAPLDLLRAWDRDGEGKKSGAGEFSRHEVLVMMKAFTRDLELWDAEVRDVVIETFTRLSGSDNLIDIEEFQKFLQGGWKVAKKLYEDGMGIVRKSGGPANVPPEVRPVGLFGDPRWPNRIWPARRGATSYAKRLMYRPSPTLRKDLSTYVPPLLPAGRATINSSRTQHYITSPDGRMMRQFAALHKPRMTHCYFQQHTPDPRPDPKPPPAGHLRQRSPPPLPFAAVSISSDMQIWRLGALPHAGASRTGVMTTRPMSPPGARRFQSQSPQHLARSSSAPSMPRSASLSAAGVGVWDLM